MARFALRSGTSIRSRITSAVRRRRRVFASAAAFAAVVCGLAALTGPSAPTEQIGSQASAALAGDEIGLPVTIPRGADLVTIGDHVDLLAQTPDGKATTVVHDGRVLQSPRSAGFGGSSSTMLIAATRTDALSFAALPPDAAITMIITDR